MERLKNPLRTACLMVVPQSSVRSQSKKRAAEGGISSANTSSQNFLIPVLHGLSCSWGCRNSLRTLSARASGTLPALCCSTESLQSSEPLFSSSLDSSNQGPCPHNKGHPEEGPVRPGQSQSNPGQIPEVLFHLRRTQSNLLGLWPQTQVPQSLAPDLGTITLGR